MVATFNAFKLCPIAIYVLCIITLRVVHAYHTLA